MRTYGNDDNCSESTYKVSYHAFSNEHPFYQSLYFDSLDLMKVEHSVDNENVALPNVKLLSDIATSLRPLSDNCIRPRCKRIYRRKKRIT